MNVQPDLLVASGERAGESAFEPADWRSENVGFFGPIVVQRTRSGHSPK
jgi:hypothetical protein